MAANDLSQIADAAAPRDRLAIVAVDAEGAVQSALDHAAFEAEVEARAARLRRLGLPRGSVVGVGGGNRLDAVLATFAAWRAGLVVTPLNARVPAATRHGMLEDAGAVAVLASVAEAAGEGLAPWPHIALDGAAPPGFAPREEGVPPPAPGGALVMFTSGSTGRPKAVAITHAAYAWAIAQFGFLRAVEEGRCGLVAAPLFHMNGQFHLLQMLAGGATVVLMERFEPLGFGRAIEAHAVARVTGVPTMLALLMRAIDAGARFDFRHVASVAMGSAPFSAELRERAQRVFPNAVITNGWGTTETGPAAFGPHPRGLPAPPLAIGHPIEGVEVRLEGGPHADEGVLWLRTPMTLRRYLNDEGASAASVREGFFVTGDRMRRDADGFFHFLGRADDRLQVGGENVHPAEVERLLERHPQVHEAAVVALPDSVKHEVPVAFVVARPGTAPAAEAIKAWALANGPAHAHPRHVAVLEALPLSAANKVDRRVLVAEALRRFAPR
jgi:acyl-CoA synthetase (AMP-forming)/AMP-acid ligase II